MQWATTYPNPPITLNYEGRSAQQPIIFRSESRQVSMSVEEVSLCPYTFYVVTKYHTLGFFLSTPGLVLLVYSKSNNFVCPKSKSKFKNLSTRKVGVRNSHAKFEVISQHPQYECIHWQRSGESEGDAKLRKYGNKKHTQDDIEDYTKFKQALRKFSEAAQFKD